MSYPAFGKIPRLNRDVVITEKIDGTNGLVYIGTLDDGPAVEPLTTLHGLRDYPTLGIWAGSRNRWLSVQSDNFGFAKWVQGNASELAEALETGHHYGEWWGQGIQRKYGLTEKRFSLFNSFRWCEIDGTQVPGLHVVPVIHEGNASTLNEDVEDCLANLRSFGSQAAPGFMNPEGIVIYHEASKQNFKVTLDNDDKPKG